MKGDMHKRSWELLNPKPKSRNGRKKAGQFREGALCYMSTEFWSYPHCCVVGMGISKKGSVGQFERKHVLLDLFLSPHLKEDSWNTCDLIWNLNECQQHWVGFTYPFEYFPIPKLSFRWTYIGKTSFHPYKFKCSNPTIFQILLQRTSLS